MTRRWPSLLVIAAVLVGGLLLGRGSPPGAEAGEAPDPVTLLAVAPPDDALDASWFCAGQSAGDGTVADGRLVLANVADEDATATIRATSSEGEEATAEVAVPGRGTERLRLADVLEGDWVAAQVDVQQGTVVVEHEVVGPHGRDAAPCQNRTSDRWYVPSGASTRDATLTLAVFNPHAGPATVDMSFVTGDSLRVPADLQGIPVPPRSIVAVDVSSVVTEREVMAATVTTRRGRVVVDRIQTFDGTGAATTAEEEDEEPFRREGLTVTPAVPEARPVWAFPAGVSSGYTHERLVLFNPSEGDTAEVEVSFDLDEPERNGVLDPFPITIPPGELEVFEVDAIETIPAGVTHTVRVRAENGVPVVAERELVAEGESPTIGVAASTGSPVASPRWAFAIGPRPGDDSGRVVVTNPGSEAVDVELSAFGDGQSSAVPDGTFTLEPGARHEVGVDDLAEGRTSIEVVATGPVVAERRLLSLTTAPAPADEGEEGEEGEDGQGEEGEGEEGGEAEGGAGSGASATIGIPLGRELVLLD